MSFRSNGHFTQRYKVHSLHSDFCRESICNLVDREKAVLYLSVHPLRCFHQMHNFEGILQRPCSVSEVPGKIPFRRFCHLLGQLYGLLEAGNQCHGSPEFESGWGKLRRTPISLSCHCWDQCCISIELLNKSNNTTSLRQGVNYHLKVKCQLKETTLGSHCIDSHWIYSASYCTLIQHKGK